MIMSNLKDLIATTIRVWKLDQAPRMAAALAFYLTTSVIPMMILSVIILGKVLHTEFNRIDSGSVGKLIHKAFNCEYICQ